MSNEYSGCIGIKKVIFEDSSESLSTPINTCFFDSPIEYFYMGREVGWDDEKEKGCKFIETIHKVTIGSFVSELKGNHFAYCTNLKELILDDNSNTLKLNESVSLGSGSKLIITPFNGCNIETLYYGRPISLTDYIITDSLKEIIVGDVTSIGNIFKSCENISTIKLTSNVPPTISNDCFTDKQFIYISVIVPSGSMPTYQSAEGWNKFWNITESDELVKFFVVNGIKYKIKSGNKVTVAKNTEPYSGNIIIPSSVTYASKEYEVVDVGEAFSSSPNLLKVTLPSSLKNIAPYAFKDDTELQEVILPEGLLVLGAYAFDNSGLKTMTIPSTIISFGENAFNNCDKLKELIFEDGNIPLIFPTTKQVHRSKLYTSEINHKEYTYIYKQYCGYFCNLNIEKIYLGRNLSDERTYSLTYNGMSEWTLNQYNGPFECLPKLKELIIGENVSALGPDTYSEKFTLISNKLYMSYSPVASFKECNSIIKVKVNAVTPPTGADFSSTAYANATLVVPDNSIEDYKAATGWKEFYNIISESEATGISNVETNTEQNVKIENGNIVVENIRGIVNIYDIAGTLVKRVKADGNRIDITLPQRGIYIVKAGRTAVKVVI